MADPQTRPTAKFDGDAVRGPVIGIDLGGANIQAAVVDAGGVILGRKKRDTCPEEGADSVIARMAAAARRAAEKASIPWNRVEAVGIGSPGPLDPETGVVAFAPNLGWRNVPLRDLLEVEFGVPVSVDNDVNVGTLGEARLGAGIGKSEIVGIFVGTGIGGGIISGGRLFRGARGMAGEIGHMVVDIGGAKCPCGSRGCLEAMASRNAILREIRRSVRLGRKTVLTRVADGNPARVRSRQLAVAAAQGDEVVLKALRKAARALGAAVGSLTNILNPEIFVIGGGVMDMVGDVMLPWIVSEAKRHAMAATFDGVEIVAGVLGDDAGVLGASFLAREALAAR